MLDNSGFRGPLLIIIAQSLRFKTVCGCQGVLGCEISFPSIDSRLKQVFVFFRPPELVNFRLKSLLETTFAQSKQICSFDDGDTHTRSIDLVGVESAHSAIEVKDSQMKPETPNASHATPHFWREMQMKTHQARQVDLSQLRRSRSADSRPNKARSARQEVDL